MEGICVRSALTCATKVLPLRLGELNHEGVMTGVAPPSYGCKEAALELKPDSKDNEYLNLEQGMRQKLNLRLLLSM
jgi:hypothetical protein